VSGAGQGERGLFEAELVSLDIAWEELSEPVHLAPEQPTLTAAPECGEALEEALQSAWTKAQVTPRNCTDAASGLPPIRYAFSTLKQASAVACAPAARSRPGRAPNELAEIGLPNERSGSGAIAILTAIALALATFFILAR
jgi:hypothetical protein